MLKIAPGVTTAFVVATVVGLIAQATPQQSLNDAKEALDSVPTSGLKPDDAKQMAGLKKDFADLQAAYAASISMPATPGETTPVATGQQAGFDWQSKYAAVHTDLMLVGNTGGQANGQLDQFLARLDMFHNTALAQATVTPTAPPSETPLVQTSACPSVAAVVSREAVSLLDRVQTIVDDTLYGKVPKDEAVATSRSKELREAGKVSIDRASLDEIMTEVGHLKLLLQESSAQ